MSSRLIVSSTSSALPADNITTTHNLDPTATDFQPGFMLPVPFCPAPGRISTNIRMLPLHDRQALLYSAPIPIYIGNCLLATISSALLLAVSRHAQPFITYGYIALAPDTDSVGVTTLLNHLLAVTNDSAQMSQLDNIDFMTSLAVCQASYRLGMGKLTKHVFYRLEQYLLHHLPSGPEIDAVWWFRASHPKLYHVMLRSVATKLREGSVANECVFRAFCSERYELDMAIQEKIEELDGEETKDARRKVEADKRKKEGETRRAMVKLFLFAEQQQEEERRQMEMDEEQDAYQSEGKGQEVQERGVDGGTVVTEHSTYATSTMGIAW
ncbi:hypothetical protein E8E13_008702 [Curvularia kusanoi]|uniref:Uncharacterized protein n=1 Tax=Curvularia kusanoi TaxID=90978 RepID=A0A9P4WDB3_CURKU|nr:hypothetical protein E8E13_008702 [Curvularia kusanoi]